MYKKISLFTVIIVFASIGIALALPGKPSFCPRIYGDGIAWGTKGTAFLNAPNDNNLQSYDILYLITNSNNAATQLPVSDAAPGNPNYNGGRWFSHTVTWTAAGFAAHGTVPILKSYADIMLHYNLGHLDIVPGSPDPDTTPDYFDCPLLPVKDFECP